MLLVVVILAICRPAAICCWSSNNIRNRRCKSAWFKVVGDPRGVTCWEELGRDQGNVGDGWGRRGRPRPRPGRPRGVLVLPGPPPGDNMGLPRCTCSWRGAGTPSMNDMRHERVRAPVEGFGSRDAYTCRGHSTANARRDGRDSK